jgi:hypothetical protein
VPRQDTWKSAQCQLLRCRDEDRVVVPCHSCRVASQQIRNLSDVGRS